MSSDDSDSDVCDFMSDVGKLGKDKFWKKFKLDNEGETVEVPEDNKTKNKESDPQVRQPSNDFPDETKSEVVLETLESSHVNIKVDECTSINIGNRLDTLSRKLVEIRTASSKPQRGVGKRGRKSRGRAKQIALPYTRLVRSAPMVETSQADVSQSHNPSALTPIKEKGYSTRLRKRLSNRPPLEIVLSSDDESHKETMLNRSSEDLNPIVSVKVLWKSVNIHTFQIKKFQTFQLIKEHYVTQKQANPALLYFTLNDKEIDLEYSSVVSLRLQKDDIIEGSTLSENYLEDRPSIIHPKMGDLKLKVQFNSKRSNTFHVCCQKTDKMEIIFWQVMLEVKEPVENLKIYFDGELLNPRNDIAALDLTDGDCFDLIVLQC